MGNVVSVRRSRAGGGQAPGPLSRWRRGRRAPPEVPLSSPETLRRNPEEALPLGPAPARRRRPRAPPTAAAAAAAAASSLWVAGDGGEREEIYRYHRRRVSSAEPVEGLRPLGHRAQGPPMPLRDLACARVLGERHPGLCLLPSRDGDQQDG